MAGQDQVNHENVVDDQEDSDQKLNFIMEGEPVQKEMSADMSNPKHFRNLMIEVKHEKALLTKENKRLMNRLRLAQEQVQELTDKNTTLWQSFEFFNKTEKQEKQNELQFEKEKQVFRDKVVWKDNCLNWRMICRRSVH